MIECKDYKDFESFARGDTIEAKVLKVSKQQDDINWLELTRLSAHMDKPVGLDEKL